MSNLVTSIQHHTSVLASAIRQEKEGIQIKQKEIKLSLFALDITINGKNPKESTKKLQEPANSELQNKWTYLLLNSGRFYMSQLFFQ